MKIVRIFKGNNNLLSFKYDNEDENEFDRLFDLWNDIEFLYDFFEDNVEYLKDIYWTSESIDNVVLETRELAGKFEDQLLDYEFKDDYVQQMYLEEIFEPLEISSFRDIALSKTKAKKSWLRIYALKVNKSSFIITGGAIKLTAKMEEHEITKNELVKLEICRHYLIAQGITDIVQVEKII
jgi:hypothetical protein